jgi:lipoate synthase
VSFPTAAKAVEALVNLGIVRELTGQRRNRVFAYDRYLSVLSEGKGQRRCRTREDPVLGRREDAREEFEKFMSDLRAEGTRSRDSIRSGPWTLTA